MLWSGSKRVSPGVQVACYRPGAPGAAALLQRPHVTVQFPAKPSKSSSLGDVRDIPLRPAQRMLNDGDDQMSGTGDRRSWVHCIFCCWLGFRAKLSQPAHEPMPATPTPDDETVKKDSEVVRLQQLVNLQLSVIVEQQNALESDDGRIARLEHVLAERLPPAPRIDIIFSHGLGGQVKLYIQCSAVCKQVTFSLTSATAGAATVVAASALPIIRAHQDVPTRPAPCLR